MKLILIFLIFPLLLSFSCSESKTKTEQNKTEQINQSSKNILDSSEKHNILDNKPEIYESQSKLKFEYELIDEFYHDSEAYTQGYIFKNNILFESTGQFGSSSLRKVDPKTGNLIQKISIGLRYFAEGIEIYNDKIYLLTWKNNICKVYDSVNFGEIGEFRYSGEGWGLCLINDVFYMSNGTNELQIIDPKTFKVIRKIDVFDQDGYALGDLNELEYAKGYIFANIWMTDKIAIINPIDGKVLHIMDFHQLRKRLKNNSTAETFNGIAYDKNEDIFYLTGKNWNKTFKVRIY
jgi:glutaminyl-peptide cyclotransferase